MSWPRSRSRTRVLRDEPLQLGHELGVVAERELRVGELLRRREPQLLQAPDLDRREGRLGDVGKSGSPPERERLAQLL